MFICIKYLKKIEKIDKKENGIHCKFNLVYYNYYLKPTFLEFLKKWTINKQILLLIFIIFVL
jgi:hypothetical protein